MTLRRAAAGVLLALALVAGLPGAASAHANLLTSDPANGATMPTAPTEIRMTFSERPDVGVSAVELLDSGGATISTGAPALDGAATLVVGIPEPLPDGVYTVSWRVVSVDDGHVTAGAFAFGVGESAGTVTPVEGGSAASGPTPLGVASKALLYAGLMVLVAIAVVAMGLFGGAPKARRRLGVGAGAAAVAGAAGFLLASQRAIGAAIGTYLRSEVARDPLAIAAAALVALVLAVIALRSQHRWPAWAAGAAAAIALGIRAYGGHAAAAPTPVVAELTQWVHMLAGACWAGGLLLLILLLRERRNVEPPVEEARRYSSMAVVAIVVVVVSGLVRAVSELGGWRDLVHIWDTSYGRTLAIKVAVVLIAIALGALNRLRNVARVADDTRPLRRIVTVELVAVVGILLLTATLTSFAPPASGTQQGSAPASNEVTVSGNDFATTIQLTLTVTPGLPGPNLYRAQVVDYGTDQPASADAVTLHLRSVTRPDLPGADIKLRPQNGDWVAQALDPSVAGTFRIDADVQRGAAVSTVPLTLITRSTGTVTTTPAPGGETVAVASFDDGVRLQASTSAGTPTQIHLTAFATNGTELPLAGLALVASPLTGEPERLAVTRFSTGHFAANATLAQGSWTFDAVATTRDGRTYQVTWTAPAG